MASVPTPSHSSAPMAAAAAVGDDGGREEAPGTAPALYIDQKKMDRILAQEMNKLSMTDRNRIQEEIHGVYNAAPSETPEMIEQVLQDFCQHINTVPPEKSVAYRQALASNSRYVHDRDFQLKFIRAEVYNVPNAVKRFMAYLDLTYGYFGSEVLFRPILQIDLSKIEVEVMRRGATQVLSSRDRAGRLIFVHQGAMMGEGFDVTSRTRVLLYTMLAVSDDPTSQQRGVVAVVSMQSESNIYLSAVERIALRKIDEARPIRFSAMHITFPSDPIFQLMKMTFVLDFLNKSHWTRTKIYSGGLTMETQYNLMTFGIPALPITSTGQIKNKFHIQWLKNRKAWEIVQMSNPSIHHNWIFIPEINDVLFRGGSGTTHHYGNLEFESIVESKLPAYDATTDRKVKRDIRTEVIDAIRSRGGRFLEASKEHKSVWVEITQVDALQSKLYAFFYQHKKRLESRATQQSSQSETLSFLGSSQSKRRRIDSESGCCWTG